MKRHESRRNRPANAAQLRNAGAGALAAVLAAGALLAGLPHQTTALAAVAAQSSQTSTLGTGGGTGGGGLGNPSGPGSGGAAPATGVSNVNTIVTATGSRIRLSTTRGAMTGHRLRFNGSAWRRYHGQLVELQSAPRGSSRWTDAAQATIGPRGGFSGSWKPMASGHFALRAELLLTAGAARRGLSVSSSAPALDQAAVLEAHVAAAAPRTRALPIEVFRTALATLYGPGLYGNRTACGQKLSRSTIGVANRTLKCGTKVAVDYRGRVLVVPVIDRGPYDTGASWDLTMATGAKLGMTATSTVATLTAER